jgi:hypothetical protein
MRAWPEFNAAGDLPVGVHPASLADVVAHFGRCSPRRLVLGRRLERVFSRVAQTGGLRRFILFGSFVTAKPEPGDLDIFLIMEDSFDVSQVSGEARILFDHLAAQHYAGASIFWLRRLAAFEGESAAVEHWQIKRDGSRRGIVEVIEHD